MKRLSMVICLVGSLHAASCGGIVPGAALTEKDLADALVGHSHGDWSFMRSEPREVKIVSTVSMNDRQLVLAQVLTKGRVDWGGDGYMGGLLEFELAKENGKWGVADIDYISFARR